MSFPAAWWPAWVLSGVVGAMLGSFLNVCIHRIPRNVSVVTPPSRCPSCDTRIPFYDNVPVLGWIWLAGKCRNCRSPISPRYPLVEAINAGVTVFLVWRFGFTWEGLVAVFFVSTMLVVTLIDLDARIIPDSISLPGIGLGLLATVVLPVTFTSALIGAAAGFLLFLGIAWGYQKLTGVSGMGGGDIKLAAMLGAFLGWPGLLLTVFLASLGGTLVGGVMMMIGRGGRRTALPFGTFLAPAAVLVFLWGADLISWYWGLR